MTRYLNAAAASLAILQAGCSPTAADADAAAASDALIDRYVGTWEVDAFFAEQAVAEELRAVLGEHWEDVMLALDVNGGVEYYGSALLVSGNAPHAGGEHEAIVCVQQFTTDVQVHVGHYVDGAITVYTRHPRYHFLPTCIKDWVGLENARHSHRLRQPGNVRLQVP
ncbi:MAG TPA: hypothetical protein VF339_19245 [Gammaproteobacteria bacterium]